MSLSTQASSNLFAAPVTQVNTNKTTDNGMISFADLVATINSAPTLQASILTKNDSAKASTSQASTSQADGAIADFRAWKADYFNKGIGDDRRQEVNKYSADFEQLMTKAAAQNAYDNPQAFVQSLSTSELATLQHIQCLAEPINTASLSKEGAFNLLLSPDKAQDIDKDGFEMTGAAKGWHFPPPDAPENVKQAWKDVTANMSESDVFMLQTSFMPINIEGITTKTAYITPDTASYSKIIKEAIEGAIFSSKFDQAWQKENRSKQITGLESFLDKLNIA